MEDNSHLPPPLHSLGRLLTHTQRSAMSLADKLLAEHGLTATQWILLSALWRQDGMTNGQLARYCRLKDAAISRALDRMIKLDLIERRADEKDRRVARMYTTDKSKKLSHLQDFYKTSNDVLMEGLDQDERDQLLNLLERVLRNCEKAVNRQP